MPDKTLPLNDITDQSDAQTASDTQRRIRLYFKEHPLRRIFVAGVGSPTPGAVVNDISPRFTAVFGGRRDVLIDSGPIVMLDGDILLVPRGAWSIPTSKHENIFAAINCYDHFTSFEWGQLNAPGNNDLYKHAGPSLNINAQKLWQVIESLSAEEQSRPRALDLIPLFVREALQDCVPLKYSRSGQNEWHRALSYMHEQPGYFLTRDNVAKYIQVHPNHLSRLCKRHTGQTLQEFISTIRMTRAKYFLSHSSMSIENVADEVGYGDYHHFIKRFKLLYGITPFQFRKQHS